jgi:hypothetical protein
LDDIHYLKQIIFTAMKTNVEKSTVSVTYNRVLYVALTLLSIVNFLFIKDPMNGVITLNLAVVFDPFDQKQPWSERPLWQRIWLIVHVSLGIGILLFLAIQKIWG